MAWEFNVLVVANVTATSDELLAALRERADRGACRFTLLMPRDGTDTQARLNQFVMFRSSPAAIGSQVTFGR